MEQTKEIEIFKELGLKQQVSIREIQAEMDGMPYYPVTMRQLDKLFGMRWIGFLTMIHNWGVRRREAPVAFFFFFALLAIPVTTISIGIAYGGEAWALCLFNVFLMFEALAISVMNDVHGFLKAKVEIESVESTKVKIPYGAALRYKEAKDKGIFDGFVVAYPNVVAIEKPLSRDPAILGYKGTIDQWRGTVDLSGARLYMVVYWDIEKDRERAFRKIKDFSKFKV